MTFLLRTTEIPPLSQIVQIEQIIIVDQTGPAVNFGVGLRCSCIVGEFLQGPFIPTEVFSDGDLKATFVGDPNRMDRISQSAVGTGFVQNGSGVGYDGNGWAELKGKSFDRLVIQRVDADGVTLAAGAIKTAVKFDVDIGAAETTSTVTNKDIVIPAGTRFADDPSFAAATIIIALSQTLTIPAGTTITAGKITVDQTFLNGNGTAGATAFMVKGLTAAIALIDSVLTTDVAIPNVSSLTKIDVAGISTIDSSSGAAAAIFAPGTGTTLGDRLTAAYPAAINKTIPMTAPAIDITEIWSARNWAADAAGSIASNIRGALWTNAIDSSNQGRGRVANIAAVPANGSSSAAASAAKTAALALANAEFNTVDGDRAFISFPYVSIFASELQHTILVSAAGFRDELCNKLASEFQTSVPNSLMTAVTALEPAFQNNPLARGDYIALKAAGVGAVINDRTNGMKFQSAVTAANKVTFSTRVADNRRRFADEVQDSIVNIASKYSEFPGTTERVDSLIGEIDGYLSSLLSLESPPQQRIEAYSIDAKSGNTPQLTAAGVRVFLIKVRMLGDLNDMVFVTQIGPTVVIDQVS